MATQILGKTFDKTLIIDDQPEAREVFAETLEDVELTPVPVSGPLGDPDAYLLSAIEGPATAALCDQFLHHRNYARFEGTQLLKLFYENCFPAVLCTQYDEMIDDIRSYRRWIPSLQRPSEMDGDHFLAGVAECLTEFAGEFRPSREPWRTLIRVVEDRPEEKRFFVEIPAWSSTVVPLRYTGVPESVTGKLGEGWRCRAKVNLGAEELHDLYVCEWEVLD
jgi:CheY-like chemotaxis protein